MTPACDHHRLHTRAPAKINWTLEVLGRRADGYHEVRTLLQSIDLCDEVSVRSAEAYSLTVTGRAIGDLPPEENLITRAVRLFPDHLAARPIAVTVEKRIPAAAGLGGGSSDAAATLRLLRSHWRLGASHDLSRAAASLGSDVPFFLEGGVQLAAGRGEVLTPLALARPLSLTLLLPPITIANKTAQLYARLRPEHYTDGSATTRLADRLRAGDPPRPEDCVNVFDAVADDVFPGLSRYRHILEQATGSRAILAGAGPTLFAFTPDTSTLRAEGIPTWSPIRADGAEVFTVATRRFGT